MVQATNLRKDFRTQAAAVSALRGVSFDVSEGNLLTLLGPSGCGKSTTLRCIAGLEQPDSGTIRIGDRFVFSSEEKRYEPPERRPVGMVFQSYAIWPHMTVFDNVAYPLIGHRLSRQQIAQEVHRVLSLVGLADLGDRSAPQLSGGQQQRVAVARALVANPSILLLDEPLSNLDAKLRQHMRLEIRELQQRSGITTIYVTHDQEEALAVSDEILFMMDGVIVEGGRPEDIYRRPKKKLTAEFFGEANFIEGVAKGHEGGYLMVDTPFGLMACWGNKMPAGERACVFFRPEDVTATRERPGGNLLLSSTVLKVTFLGKTVECVVGLDNGDRLKVNVDSKFRPNVTERVYLSIEPDACSVVSV